MSVTTPNRYYPEQVEAFLRIFAQDQGIALPQLETKLHEVVADQIRKFGKLESQSPHEKTFGLLHPVAIAEALIGGLDYSAEDKNKLAEIISKSYPIDPATGYYVKQCGPTILGLAHLAAEKSEVPVCLIEGDFANMAGCNKAVGRENTDKLLHEISRIVQERFAPTEEDKRRGKFKEVQCIRAGGDEVRIVVYGYTKKEVDAILRDKIHPEINLLSAKFGVHQAEHTKKYRLPGFGAAFACVDLKKNTPTTKLDDQLCHNIHVQKLNDAFLHFGLTDDEAITHYVKTYITPQLISITSDQLPSYVEEINQSLEKAKRDTCKRWDALTGEGGAYRDLYTGYHYPQNPRDFFEAYSQEHRANIDSLWNTIALPPREDSAKQIPFWDKTLIKSGQEPPEAGRLRMALKAFDFKAAKEEEIVSWSEEHQRYELRPELKTIEQDPKRSRLQALVVDLMAQFDAPDPAVHCRTSLHMLEDADIYSENQHGLRVVHFEVTNLSGLNNISLNLGDAVLRETGKYIRQALTKSPANRHLADHLYYEGNGRWKVLLPANFSTSKIEHITSDVSDNMDKHILAMPVKEFALTTYANPSHGRQEDSGKKIESLEKRLAALSQYRARPIELMSEIPHPKELEKPVLSDGKYKEIINAVPAMHWGSPGDRQSVVQKLGLKYSDCKIGKNVSVEQGLIDFNTAIETAGKTPKEMAYA